MQLSLSKIAFVLERSKDLVTKSLEEPVVEAMEAAAPVGSAAPAASIGIPEVISASEVK